MDTTGTVYLVQTVDQAMRSRGQRRSWKNTLQSAIAHVTPARVLAEQHRRMAAPGSAEKAHDSVQCDGAIGSSR